MAVKIFISYAHGDEPLLNGLTMHLNLLQKGLIEIWDDREISVGTEQVEQIQAHLEGAQIILLLLSPNFLGSKHRYINEMERAIEQHNQGKARVIPIILRPILSLQNAPFEKLQPLPTDGKPVTKWPDRSEAFLNVVEGILKVVRVFSGDAQEQDQATALITEARKEILITKAREEMVHLIRLYKDLRYFISASFDKTRNMENVRQSIQEWSKRAKYTPQEITSFLLSLDEGERLAGLAILQWRHDDDPQNVDNFEQMINFLEKPRSPYEHYHTLEVLKGMKPHLSNQQQGRLRDAVRNHIYDRNADSEHWPAFCREIPGGDSNERG